MGRGFWQTHGSVAVTIEGVWARLRLVSPIVLVAHKIVAERHQATWAKASTKGRVTVVNLRAEMLVKRY